MENGPTKSGSIIGALPTNRDDTKLKQMISKKYGG